MSKMSVKQTSIWNFFQWTVKQQQSCEKRNERYSKVIYDLFFRSGDQRLIDHSFPSKSILLSVSQLSDCHHEEIFKRLQSICEGGAASRWVLHLFSLHVVVYIYKRWAFFFFILGVTYLCTILSLSSCWGCWWREGEGGEWDDGADQTWRRPATRQESGEQGEDETAGI